MTYNPEQVDLTNCDREPIHILGRIQSHGILMVLHEPDLTIQQISSNADTILQTPLETLLQQPIDTVLGQAFAQNLQTALANEDINDNPFYLWTLELPHQRGLFDAIIHRHNAVLILELEPCVELRDSALDVARLVRNAISKLQRANEFVTFCQIAADEVHHITGFDRVMVYKFAEDGHGSVIAEHVREGLESFLGLHYPASDIPQQARALYVLNWLRLIGDVNDQPATIVPELNPSTDQPVDLSFSVLRSVSPIHIEYLQNMGVGASMSISLVRDGSLWGLIACHHYGAKFVGYETRSACEFLAQAVSLQIDQKQNRQDQEYVSHLNRTIEAYIANIRQAPRWETAFTDYAPSLMEFIKCDGVALCSQFECSFYGATPPQSAIDNLLIKWLQNQVIVQVYATDHLVDLFPEWRPYQAVASGILVLPIAPEVGNFIIWFRKEQVQTVHWAGEPSKPVEVTEQGLRLSPRKSFELWKQTVEGYSLPWQAQEIAAVKTLHTFIFEILLEKSDELSRMNTDLARSNADLDAFTYVASHDLKEPLRGIHNYAHFLLEDYANKLDADGREYITTIVRLTQRMSTLIESLLMFSQVGRLHLAIKEVDLNQVVADVLDTFYATLRERNIKIIQHPLPTLECDSVRIGQIYHNLISNALKYNTRDELVIEIGTYSLDQLKPEYLPPNNQAISEPILYVRDNGIGIPKEHFDTIFVIFKRLHGRDEYGGGTGAGLTIVKKIIERHNGSIWLYSTINEGTTFFFTLQGPLT